MRSLLQLAAVACAVAADQRTCHARECKTDDVQCTTVSLMQNKHDLHRHLPEAMPPGTHASTDAIPVKDTTSLSFSIVVQTPDELTGSLNEFIHKQGLDRDDLIGYQGEPRLTDSKGNNTMGPNAVFPVTITGQLLMRRHDDLTKEKTQAMPSAHWQGRTDPNEDWAWQPMWGAWRAAAPAPDVAAEAHGEVDGRRNEAEEHTTDAAKSAVQPKGKHSDTSKDKVYSVYKGQFSHPAIASGHKKKLKVVVDGNESNWAGMGLVIPITASLDGEHAVFSDGETVLDGKVNKKGGIKGTVTQNNVGGGSFRLRLAKRKVKQDHRDHPSKGAAHEPPNDHGDAHVHQDASRQHGAGHEVRHGDGASAPEVVRGQLVSATQKLRRIGHGQADGGQAAADTLVPSHAQPQIYSTEPLDMLPPGAAALAAEVLSAARQAGHAAVPEAKAVDRSTQTAVTVIITPPREGP